VLFARELDRLWGDAGVRAFAPHPGIVADTRFNRSAGDDVRRALGIVDDTGAAVIDPPSAARPSTRAPPPSSSPPPARCWSTAVASTWPTATSPRSTRAPARPTRRPGSPRTPSTPR